MPTVKTPDFEAIAKAKLSPGALKIFRKQMLLQDAIARELLAFRDQRQSELPDLQRLEVDLQARKSAPQRDPASEQEIAAEIAAIKNGWKAEDAARRARELDFMNSATPSAIGILEPALRLDIKTKTRDYNYAEELPEGQTVRSMVDLRRDEAKTLLQRRGAIVKAPQTMAETIAVLKAECARVSDKVLQQVRGARFLDYNEDRGRFEQRRFNMPRLAIYDGVGKALAVPDGIGLLCALFPDEVAERLAVLSGAVEDDAKGLKFADRVAALEDINEEILQNARSGEFWIRQCQAANVAAGPRWTEDYRAILDVH